MFFSKISNKINNFVQSKVEDYLLYTENEKSAINSFIDRIDNSEIKEAFSWNEKTSVSSTRYLLIPSVISNWWIFKIFFLTNKNVKYRSFMDDFTKGKKDNKFIIFILLETIDLKMAFRFKEDELEYSKLIVYSENFDSEVINSTLNRIKILCHEPNILLKQSNAADDYFKEIEKKCDGYSFDNNEKLKINQFIKTIGNSKYCSLFKWRKSLQTGKEQLNEVFNSKLTIRLFILTKEKLESDHFRIEYESCISLNKIPIFFLLEDVDLEKQINIDVNKTIVFTDDTNANKLEYELFRILLDREYENNRIKSKPIHEANLKSEIEKFYLRIKKEEDNMKLYNWETFLIDENQNFKVFFLAKDTLSSDDFKIENKLALIDGKLVIYVFVESFDTNTALSDGIVFFQPIESELNNEAFIILKRLLFNLLNDSIKDYSRDLQPFSNFKEKLTLKQIVKIQKLSGYEILVAMQDEPAQVFNIETCTIVAKFNSKLVPHWIGHLKLILVVEPSLTFCLCKLYDTSGRLNNEIRLPGVFQVTYSHSNKKTYFYTSLIKTASKHSVLTVYIYDANLKFEKEILLDIAKLTMDKTLELEYNCKVYLMCLGDKIFAFIEKFKIADEILVFDSNLNYFTSIENVMRMKNMKNSIVYDQNEPNYFFLKMGDSIQIFSTKYLSVIGVVQSSYELQAVNGSKMLLKYLDQFFIYKMNFLKKENKFEDKFICKLDPFNTHLYKNPCKLPCGNSACFLCLWKNIFIDKNKFICCFDNCPQIQHSVQYNLPKDIELQQALLDNINILCGVVIQEFNETSYVVNQDEFIENFEARFDIIEQNFEIRIESLFVKLDQLSSKMIDQVNLFEKKIISKPISKPFRINIFRNKIFQVSQIGSISYHEVKPDIPVKGHKNKHNTRKVFKNEDLTTFVKFMKNFF